MKKNVDLTSIAHDRTALFHRARELETENAKLREAAAHFLGCRLCKEGYPISKNNKGCLKHLELFLPLVDEKAV